MLLISLFIIRIQHIEKTPVLYGLTTLEDYQGSSKVMFRLSFPACIGITGDLRWCARSTSHEVVQLFKVSNESKNLF